MTNEMDSTEPTNENTSGRSRVRRMAVAGAAVGVLGGAAVGLLATLPGSTSAASPETTAAVDTTVPAETPSAPPGDESRPTDDERLAKRTEAIRDQLQGLIDDGTITADQADAVAATLAEAGPADGRRGPGLPGGPGGKFGPMGDELAQVLGLDDAAALREQLQAGNSLADIAEANGVSIDTVKDFLRTQAETRLAEAVEAGKLTQEEADAKLAELDDHLDEMIDGTMPPGGPGRGHRSDAAPDNTTSEGGDTGATDNGATDTSLDA